MDYLDEPRQPTSGGQYCTPIGGHIPTPIDNNYEAGLGEDAVRKAAHRLRPYRSDQMLAYLVSLAVNSVKNDGRECLEPAA